MNSSRRLSPDDSRIIWVSPGDGGGRGSFADPLRDLPAALTRVQPGETIVLMEGEYLYDVTIQKSGIIDHPITIVAQSDNAVRVMGSCWYFYDVCDMIVSGVSFINSPAGAISVVGTSLRNRFENISFVDCGGSGESTCTLFFGGSGGGCNIVEECRFERGSKTQTNSRAAVPIALMVAEGDVRSGEPNRNHVFRRNHFVNYGYAILVGSGDAVEGEFGHIVEHNTIESCAIDGIHVKCGDTTVRGNTLRNCARDAISLVGGRGSLVENNRILDGGVGIRVSGEAHTIQDNCIIRCRNGAIDVVPVSEEQKPAENIFVENNTFAQCGFGSAAILLDYDSTCIVRHNLFAGESPPYQFRQSDRGRTAAGKASSFIADNLCSMNIVDVEGCRSVAVDFTNAGGDDFENASGYGAVGWVTKPGPHDPDPSLEADPAESLQECEDHCCDERQPEREDAADRSFFFGRDE